MRFMSPALAALGPVVIDLPKDTQQAETSVYKKPSTEPHRTYRPKLDPEAEAIAEAVALIAQAKRPMIYAGGGVINSGPEAFAKAFGRVC